MPSYLAKIRLQGLDADGLQSDKPASAWSSVTNWNAREGTMSPLIGTAPILGGPTGQVVHGFGFKEDSLDTRYWITFTDAGASHVVYVNDNTTEKTITGLVPGTTSVNSVTSGVLNNNPFWNAGYGGKPQGWGKDFTTPTVAAPLAGWPALHACKAIRSYGDFLVAMNIQDAGLTTWTDQGDKLMWSDRATPLSLPTTWTASATNEAGDATLADGGGEIIDGAVLGSAFYIFKQNSMWKMEEIGLPTVMQVRPAMEGIGAIARNCIQNFYGKLLVVTQGDVVATDGRQAVSIIDKINRRYLFNNIDKDNTAAVHTAYDSYNHEFWVCFPGDDTKTYCDQALVFNGSEWTRRELQGTVGTSYVGKGWTPTTGTHWTLSSGPDRERLVAFEPDGTTDSLAQQIDTGINFDHGGTSTKINTELIREGISLTEDRRMVTIKRLMPMLDVLTTRGAGGASFMISVGATDRLGTDYTYNTAIKWKMGSNYTDPYIPLQVTGKYFAFKVTQDNVSSGVGANARLSGFDIEYEDEGSW